MICYIRLYSLWPIYSKCCHNDYHSSLIYAKGPPIKYVPSLLPYFYPLHPYTLLYALGDYPLEVCVLSTFRTLPVKGHRKVPPDWTATFFDNIRHYSTTFDIIWQYSTSFDNIRHYSTIFASIRRNSTFFDRRTMLKNVAVHNFCCGIMSRTLKKVAVHSEGG